jgi:hypothetical protein
LLCVLARRPSKPICFLISFCVVAHFFGRVLAIRFFTDCFLSPVCCQGDHATVSIDMPEYEARQRWQARDGLCGIEAFRVMTLLVFARIFGCRTCPFCPSCNHNSESSIMKSEPCQDMFGSCMLPMGGYCGGADAFGGAVEHQHDGNPHFHGFVHLVNIYQHNTLDDVARAIRGGFLDASALKR